MEDLGLLDHASYSLFLFSCTLYIIVVLLPRLVDQSGLRAPLDSHLTKKAFHAFILSIEIGKISKLKDEGVRNARSEYMYVHTAPR